jgi:hypothetical protein
MQTRILTLALVCFLFSTAFAQKKPVSFAGAVQVGILEGEQGGSLQFGAMAGVKLKKWKTSIGSGLDYYGVRSIPLYLNVQHNILAADKTPFVFAGAGYHFPWAPTNTKDGFSSWSSSVNTDGGLYYHAGIGYELPALKKAALFFAAGLSSKHYREEILIPVYCVMGPCPEYKEKVAYRFRRLSIAMGLRF